MARWWRPRRDFEHEEPVEVECDHKDAIFVLVSEHRLWGRCDACMTEFEGHVADSESSSLKGILGYREEWHGENGSVRQ